MINISNLIPSFDLVHTYNNNHFIFKCKIIDLIKGPFINWDYNRPADINRAYDIAKYAYNMNLKNYDLDWLLYTTYCSKDNIIKIWDGIHRYAALSIIYEENKKLCDSNSISQNILCINDNVDWLFEKYILISIRLNSTFGEIVDLFQSLNKSHPVPDLYITNKDIDKKEIIENIVDEWSKKYKSHFSTNIKPNVPNINITLFTDLLDKIYKKYKITKINLHLLNELLYQMNERIKNNIPKKISPAALKKCNESGCFLFLYKKEVLEDMF